MKATRVVYSAVVALAFFAPFLQPQKAGTAPVPAQLTGAKKVFISYGGGSTNVAGYSGSDTRVYEQFYAAMKAWGHYDLAPTPSDAELAFEISFSSPLSAVSPFGGGAHGVPVTSDPHLRLGIIDVKTHITLWTVIEHIDQAILQGNRDKNFDRAMNALVNDVAKLAGTLPAISQANEQAATTTSK